jgi:uncharacterized Zn finger protein
MTPPRQPPWWEEVANGPIAVEGGIKAKSKRGAIGEQWWSRRFIAVLEYAGIGGRLQRGRSYARKGQVIEFALAAGKVTARVQGSRPVPYQVSVGVRPLTAAQWSEVESKLASQALFRARLLAGEMPAEIEEVFESCGTPLFPQAASDLAMSCDCPDWGEPCKHVAALCYVLAEEFDADPFAMLAWRGKGREELLAELRGKTAPGAGSPAAGTRPAAAATSPAHDMLDDVTGAPLAESLADYWSPGLSQARLRVLPASPATPPDLLLRIADPPQLQVRGTSLRDLLAPAYARLAEPETAAAAGPATEDTATEDTAAEDTAG